MEEKVVRIEVTAVGNFEGTNVKKNKSMDLKFIFGIEERSNIIQSVMLVGQDISVFTKKGKEKAKFLGVFRFNSLHVDRDGETKITFNTMTEDAKMDAINEMIENSEYIKVKMVADVEMEDKEDDEE